MPLFFLWKEIFMNRKIAIYLRVSTLDQARNGYGLGDQELQCKKYLDLYYPNETNVEVYKDDGFSAKNLERPAMERMIEEIKQHKIFMIVAFKLDRLTRSVVDTYKLIKTVSDYDCSLVAVVDRIDISSANGRMLVGILSVISQWEREVISERTIAGLVEMARNGKYCLGGREPFGWTRTENNKLIINEKNAEILNWWADLYLDGYSLEDIREYTYKNFNFMVNWQTIKNNLLREMNIGIFKYRDVPYENVVPPIMTIEKYNKVQECAKYRETHCTEKRKYHFHNLVYCEKCKKRMSQVCTIKHQSNCKIHIYRYYYCKQCNYRISQDEIEKEVIYFLINKIEENEELSFLQEEQNKLDKKKDSLSSAYVNGSIEIDDFVNTINKIESSIKKINDRINNISSFDFFCLDDNEKYRFIHMYIKKVVIDSTLKQVKNIEYKSKIKV